MTKTIQELKIKVESGTVLTRVRREEGIESTHELLVLVPKAISEGISLDSLDRINVDINDIASDRIKTTKIGDIVLKLSTPYDSVYVDEAEQGLVIPSYFAVLRGIDSQVIDPKYLAYVLGSTYGKKYLMSLSSGVVNAMIKLRDILTIPIPMLPLEEQEILGNLYSAFWQKRAAMKVYLANEEALMNTIIIDSIRKEV